MIKPTFGFVVEYVPDIQTAKRFYIDVLGLDVERDHPTFVQFRHFAIANDESLSGSRDPEAVLARRRCCGRRHGAQSTS